MKTEAAVSEKQNVTRSIRMAQMYPVMMETLSGGGAFTLTVTGMSMFPTLRGDRDRVTLQKAPERFRKYDLPLYLRSDGSFVLHRIIRVEKDGTYTCCGDHQNRKELGLRQEQMLGIVTQIERKGKRFPTTKLSYRIWVRFWVDCFFLRPLCLTGMRKLQQFKKHFTDKKKQNAGKEAQ